MVNVAQGALEGEALTVELAKAIVDHNRWQHAPAEADGDHHFYRFEVISGNTGREFTVALIKELFDFAPGVGRQVGQNGRVIAELGDLEFGDLR